MNHLRSIIFTILIILCLVAAAQQKKVIIFNGHFFNELPAEVKNSMTSQDRQMFFISTPEQRAALKNKISELR